jgi:hypothetical protein
LDFGHSEPEPETVVVTLSTLILHQARIKYTKLAQQNFGARPAPQTIHASMDGISRIASVASKEHHQL